MSLPWEIPNEKRKLNDKELKNTFTKNKFSEGK
jgi:hypothetical protein